ncbi:MAG: phosphate propanoyltransferase [Oscillospiraceae bacterium]|nr:phosphate propanoyltransferase [Oscillospiraceae bacterium]
MPGFKVEIEGSGKHCHVTRGALDILYGDGFELEIKKMLTQPGQFVTPQKVRIEGPKGSTELSIIGPCRKVNQVELSITDAFALGIHAPTRESGDVAGSAGCKIIGPKGEVVIDEGVIVAKRHLHLTPEDADKFGLVDKQIIRVRVEGERAMVFDEVVARVSPEYATYMHVDYDEINAAMLFPPNIYGVIVD